MKIKINNKVFYFFNNFAVNMTLDSVASTFAFVAKFNPENESHKLLFKPLAYPKIEVFTDEDILLLTGTIINYDFNSNDTPELVKLSGYSKGGILEDCNIPVESYPLESNNRSLKDICERLLSPFGLNLVIDSSVTNEANLIYEKSVAEPTETVKNYISKLASQRNILVSHNNKGDIVFSKLSSNKTPLISLNVENTTNMTLSVKGQNLHSQISVIRQPSTKNKNLSPVDTISNKTVSLYRPKVKTLSSGTDTDTSRAADNELSAELKNIDFKVTIPRYEKLFPGDLVEVQNKEIYLYKRTKFIIKSVAINENEKKTSMTLDLALPASFTSDKPQNIF